MKNKMMRAASVLMVAVLLSTCAISGTFAKYVTSATSGDTARVAKWGITMSNNGADTFKDKYDTSEPYTVIGLNGSDPADVVAPGTSGGTTYEVDGKPETAYQLTFAGILSEEVFLGEGTYAYPDPYDASMGTTIAAAGYYPIKYTVAVTTSGEFADSTVTANGTYNDLKTALDKIDDMKINYAAGQECDLVITLTWAWAIDGQNNQADTILGDLAANNKIMTVEVGGNPAETPADETNYNLDISYTLQMTATQID